MQKRPGAPSQPTLNSMLSRAYTHQTAAVALFMLTPLVVATFDLREALAPGLVFWAAVLLMAVLARRRELIVGSLIGAALTASAAFVPAKEQRLLVLAFLLLIPANMALWLRASVLRTQTPGVPAQAIGVGRILLAFFVLIALAKVAHLIFHERSNKPRVFIASILQPIHFVVFWNVIAAFGTFLLPASNMPWVIALLIAALINYALGDHCVFTSVKHWLVTNKILWRDEERRDELALGPGKRRLVANLILLLIIASARYVAACRIPAADRTASSAPSPASVSGSVAGAGKIAR